MTSASSAEARIEGTTNHTPAVRKLAVSEVEPITEVMARAFDDDPTVNFLVKQDDRRTQRVRTGCQMFIDMCLPHGEVYVTDGLEGGAFWVPPGKYDASLRATLRRLPGFIRVAGLARLPMVASVFGEVEKKHPHQPHFYLAMIGVDPQHQGRGLGAELLRPVLKRCDRDRIPAYLESSNERNVTLYERHGFRVTETLHLPKGGPALRLMWREPQVALGG